MLPLPESGLCNDSQCAPRWGAPVLNPCHYMNKVCSLHVTSPLPGCASVMLLRKAALSSWSDLYKGLQARALCIYI